MWDRIVRELSAQRGKNFDPIERREVRGGCIHTAYRLTGADQSRYFVKTNIASNLEVFEAESAALEAIRSTQSIRVPSPIATGISQNHAYLILEYIDLQGRGDYAEMGRQIARLHRSTAESFGWAHHNWIGSTPQPNPRETNWITFFREHRLRHQFTLARRKGMRFTGADRLLDGLEEFFFEYKPLPALLHGDLWGGNAAFSLGGEPIAFDPACYYGDRETDLAMTELFGGFGPEFYTGYDEEWPRDPGYRSRVTLYNLYHILNHANLFGGSYANQAQSMIDELRS